MDFNAAERLLKKYNQTQLLEYYGELDGAKRQELLNWIEKIDFSAFEGVSFNRERKVGELSPADALSLSEIEKRRGAFESAGLKALREGKVAAVLLAGGQGTRLGINAPKGTFNIGVNKNLSIFECQMRELLSVSEKAGFCPRLFVMTSAVNDGETRAFFKENNYFGYDGDRVRFYVQKTAPAVSFEGKILLEEKYRPVLTPNGNGGWYSSLKEAECGKLLEKEGIEWLNVYGVDNVLQKMCDPVFVGATVLSGLACSGKVVKKASEEEKVGVLCKEDGLPAIVEYYEMPQDKLTARGADGELVYRYGVTLNYLFNVEKLNGVYANKLPYHLATKKVSCIKDGEKFTPTLPNAYKLETLAVDIVKLMGSCLGFEVVREREFAPVKNMTGVDSVDTARALLVKNGVEI
ncbi:MAG: UTP--glucose-1-phosphate uridylyltransferase [Roseburia sp.]|nr:UTP--glucose-1-phosphate uridylyltransferase [Roseburia sp.]